MNEKTWKRWSADESQFLQDNYSRLTFDQIAEYLGRTFNSVRTHAYALGLITREPIRPWTASDDKTLRKQAAQNTAREIGEMLDRSGTAVSSRAWSLKVSLHAPKKTHFNLFIEDSCLAKLRLLADRYTGGNVSEMVRRTLEASIESFE